MRVILVPMGVVAAVVVMAGAAACGADIVALGPTPVDQGIVVFLHADFIGPSQAMNVDVPDLGLVEGPCSGGAEGETPTWADCVSSIKVMPGWSAILYRDKNFKGERTLVTADTANLRTLPGPCKDTFNDCVSSIRVARQ